MPINMGAPQSGAASPQPAPGTGYASRIQPPAQVGGPQPAGTAAQTDPNNDAEFQAWLRQLFAEHQADQTPSKWNQDDEDADDKPDRPERGSNGAY